MKQLHGWSCTGDDFLPFKTLKKVAGPILPLLRELKLNLYFICKHAQGPRLGQLYRVKDPAKLVSVDNKKKVEAFITTFCDVRPLNVLRLAKLEDVSVQFQTDEVDHWAIPYPDDRCWCIGRSVDERSLRKIKLGERIEQKLLELSRSKNGTSQA